MSDIPIDVPISWARDHDSDGGIAWRESMPVVLERFPGISPTEYWNLTVADHAYLLRYALGDVAVGGDTDG